MEEVEVIEVIEEPFEDEPECVLVEDCGDENAVCSNGECKILELEVIEEPVFEAPEEVIEEEVVEVEPIVEETGLSIFNFITGNTIVEDTYCEENSQCGQNQGCDTRQNRCYCEAGFADCNEISNDGCESNDVTCGGKFEICPGGCNDNQYCHEDYGWCQCEEGYFDCDGDWLNGCESITDCKSCNVDSDCAAPRCSEWDNTVQEFSCIEGDSWIEEQGNLQFSGGCNFHPTGKVDSYVHFDSWGDVFEDFNRIREEQDYGRNWCKFEMENLKRERKEIESSLNDEYLQWFFEVYVNQDPGEWERHSSGIHDVYWKLVNVNERIVDQLSCLGINEWPSEFTEVQVSYEGDFGKIEIWEELDVVDAEKFYFGDRREGDVEIFSPYMKLWILPSKEFVKVELIESASRGEFPGPDGDRGQPGPSKEELDEIRRDRERMDTVFELSERYGGEAKFKGYIKDGEESVAEILITINPRDIVKIEPGFETSEEEIDGRMYVNFDFLFDIVSHEERERGGDRIESPPWSDGKGGIVEGFGEVKDGVVTVTKIINALRSGDVRTEPEMGIWETIKLIRDVSSIMERDDEREDFEDFEK